jgi:hypothetical protein
MKFAMRIARNSFAKPVAVLIILSCVLIVSGCGHHRTRRTASVASHKVMLDRQGITNRFGVEERGDVATFHYDGHSLSGRLRITIENDKVTVDEKSMGMLKQGDVVRIGDDGLTVNSLDHGQTAKYLQANTAPETAKKID